MKDLQERIEGSFRLLAFRRMKQRLFILEVVVFLVIAILVMAILGMSLSPAYIPMDFFTLIMLIMVLVLVTEYEYFRILEIAHTKSKSGKYLMARNTMRTATVGIVIAVVLVSFFALPPSVEALESGYTEGVTHVVPANSNYTYNYTTRDAFGLTKVNDVIIHSDYGTFRYYILTPSDYEDYVNSGSVVPPQLRKNSNYTVSAGETQIFHSGDSFSDFEQFVLLIQNQNNTGERVNIEFNYDISVVFQQYVPIMGIIFIVINGAMISMFIPIKQKYSASSIFSKEYIESADKGAEKMSERQLALDKTLSEEEISAEVEASEAIQPSEAPVAQPELPKEQARKKGVLEVATAAQQSDVPCPACNSMNSQDSSMCFSCGAVLVAQPKAVVTPEDLMHRGREFLKGSRFQDAMWCFDEVLKADHKHEQALFLKAKALQGEKRHELAIQYLNTVIQQNPAHQKAFALRGEIFETLEMYDRAVDSYEKALAFGPDEEISKKLKDLQTEDREEVLTQFQMLPGIGPAKATALYDAGFTSLEALRNAPLERLTQVKGISEKVAKKMLKEMGREV